MRDLRPAIGNRYRRVRALTRSLAPVTRTSLWELAARRPPAPEAFGAFGASSVIVPPAEVTRPERCRLGAGVLLHEGASILISEGAEGVAIGDGTVLARYAHIGCTLRVTVGRDVSSSDHIAIVDSWGPLGSSDVPRPAAPVVIGDGAYLGFGSIIGPGVTIGEGAFVGEGAVVLHDVEPHTVVYGNPATVVRRLTGAGWVGERFP